MIEIRADALNFSFPDVHPGARLSVDFQRTLRIPDDSRSYSLPPGLGRFALRHVDDYPQRVPPRWIEHGGVMLPMYQSEAMWIHFDSLYDADRDASYPFAIKIAAGKVNAVTGQSWTRRLHSDPQDYAVAPLQPWLDGFCVSKGKVRQFVAMPLGQGYTAEEQISDTAEHGGVQIIVHPMKRSVFERRFPKSRALYRHACIDSAPMSNTYLEEARFAVAEMGLGAGGQMDQEIYDDPYTYDDWDQDNSARCYVHIVNSAHWREVTGEAMPSEPVTAAAYSKAGLPWFDYYGEAPALAGSPILAGLGSVAEMWRKKHGDELPDNESVTARRVVELRKGLTREQVREGSF